MTPRGEMSGGNQRPPLSDLPPGMKMMFEARPPIQHPSQQIVKRKMPPYSGIAAFVAAFETIPPPPRINQETPAEKSARVKEEHARSEADKLQLLVTDYDPKHNVKATENPFNTLFVGRLAYETTERKLRREFEQYGAIKQIVMVAQQSRTGASKPRGYAFIEFEKEESLKEAYKHADGKKIDDRRIVVDVERGRTVRGWLPRRLGGGLGGRKARRNNSAPQLTNRTESRAPPAPSRSVGLGYSDRDRDRDRVSSRDTPRDRDRDRGADRYGPSQTEGDSRKRRSRSRERERDRDSDRKNSRRSRSPVRRR